MHMLAALDLATGKIYYRIRQRKRWREFLGLLKSLRSRRPGEKLYVVLDNFSPHKHAEVPEHGARLIIVNAEPTPYDDRADQVVREPIGTALPMLLRALGETGEVSEVDG